MKRFHVHVHVADLDRSVAFYSRLFGAEPSRREGDYAKWMLEDPRLNFAISSRAGRALGVNHLGFQADDDGELAELRGRADAALATEAGRLVDEGRVDCCYAKSDKHWVIDPQGIAWEQFHTLGSIPTFGGSAVAEPAPDAATPAAGACCGPAAATVSMPTPRHATAKPSAAGSACCGR